MAERAAHIKVAILVASGFVEEDVTGPRAALKNAGIPCSLISPEGDGVVAWGKSEWGTRFDVDVALDRARASDYDVLILCGSIVNPDGLRRNQRAIDFVCAFFESGKPVAALCRGPWTLVNVGLARGEKSNSYHSTRTNIDAFVEKLAGTHLEGNVKPTTTARQEMIVWQSQSLRLQAESVVQTAATRRFESIDGAVHMDPPAPVASV